MARAGSFLAGAGPTLAGIGIVEALLLAGARPLTPVAWPTLGLILGAVLGGLRGAIASALLIAAYCLLNLAAPERFPVFFGEPFHLLHWGAGLAVLGAAMVFFRPHVLALHRAVSRAVAAERELRLITDNIPGLVCYLDRGQRYTFANRLHADWLGAPHESVPGRTVREVWGDELYAQLGPDLARALRGERVSQQFVAADRHLLAEYVPDLAADGSVRGVFMLASDVTSLARTQEELRAARERLETALDGSSVALWDADLRTGRTYLSEAWAQMVGGKPGARVHTVQELLALVHPDDAEVALRASTEAKKGLRQGYAVEHRVRGAGGEWKWILSRGRVTERDPGTGRALRMIGTNVDITDRKRMEEALQSVALTDPLTGVANRTLLSERLRHALARRARSGGHVALLYLDIDRFKEVNDRFGHLAGDRLLKDFAERLRAGVRSADTVARLGGDEFVILLEGIKARENAEQVAQKIVARMREPIEIDGMPVVFTTSIGVAHADEGCDETRLLALADSALYRAKAAGRNAYRVA